MQRLLTRRDKSGSHRRSKSSEAGSNRVMSPKRPLCPLPLLEEAEQHSSRGALSSSLLSIFAAFSTYNGKSSAQVKTTFSEQYATSADSIPRFVLQLRPLSGNGILGLLKPSEKKQEKEDSKKIQILKQRLQDHNVTGLDESQIEYALQTKYADGDIDKAYEMLVLIQESVEGIVRPYSPNVYMQGAENRGAVTCYLDALLFAMFARLGSFEPILYTTFDDEPRRRLSTLIRLWVNMLRSGKLIQTDITEHLQEALAACGWEEAAELRQQDTSEAFGFITEKLQLPLLTMEMDIFHEGKGEDSDDHKLINERLLEVAIPQEPREGRVIRLEDCLEEYFNTRVEVVRRLDRRNTLQLPNIQTLPVLGLSTVDEKGSIAEHIEQVQSPLPIGRSELPTVDENSDTAQHAEPTELDGSSAMTPVQTPSSPGPSRPAGRPRTTSIIRHIVVTEDEKGEGSTSGDAISTHSSMRKGSLRKEVLMPAWQFFRIIPWYTAQIPTNDAQVAAHFSSTRPVLGICLKRYAITADGQPIRQNTLIDIPLQIALPHFIRDDNAADDGPLFGNFNLVLQSVVCHRGTSVHTGHYISFIRGTSKPKDEDRDSQRRNSSDSELPEYSEDRWIKFDDLAPERVTYVDIEKALTEEMPYLLFYQVQPICPEEPTPDPSIKPPSYEDSGIGMVIHEATPITTTIADPFPPSRANSSYFEGQTSSYEEPAKARISFSDDVERPRQSLTLPDSSRRGSLAFTDGSASTAPSVPVTPNEEVPQSRLSRAASRFGRRSANGEKSKSRPSSHVDENRISSTFSKFGLMGSRSSKELNRSQNSSVSDVLVTVVSVADTSGEQQGNGEVPPTEANPQPPIRQQEAPPPLQQIVEVKQNKKGKGKRENKSSEQRSGHKNQHGQDRECVMM